MTNEKFAGPEASNDPHVPVVSGQDKVEETKKPPKDEKPESLSIDDNDDFGGDPYNHTGSFYVPKFDD